MTPWNEWFPCWLQFSVSPQLMEHELWLGRLQPWPAPLAHWHFVCSLSTRVTNSNTLIVLTVNEGQVTLIICGLTKTNNVSAEVFPGCCMSFKWAFVWPFQATQPQRRVEYCMRLGCGWRRDTAAAPCPQMPHHGKGSLDSPQLAAYIHTHSGVDTITVFFLSNYPVMQFIYVYLSKYICYMSHITLVYS